MRTCRIAAVLRRYGNIVFLLVLIHLGYKSCRSCASAVLAVNLNACSGRAGLSRFCYNVHIRYLFRDLSYVHACFHIIYSRICSKQIIVHNNNVVKTGIAVVCVYSYNIFSCLSAGGYLNLNVLIRSCLRVCEA